MSDTVLNVGHNVSKAGPIPCSHRHLSYDYRDLICCFPSNTTHFQKCSHLSPTVNTYHSYSSIFLFTLTDLVNNEYVPSIGVSISSRGRKMLKSQYLIDILKDD